MSMYTCPHCGQHDLSTQRRHNCPKLPSLSIPLGPPRSMDPCANEYIARLTRELEEARERKAVAWAHVERLVDLYENGYPESNYAAQVVNEARRALASTEPTL